MDSEEGFNRFRYRSRVQIVAVIDILVGSLPFITLGFDFNDKQLAELYQDREYLVLLWTVLLCVYVLQLIMGIWLLTATRELNEYTVGNCQTYYYAAMFSFFFYTGEMAFAISSIVNTPPNSPPPKIKSVMWTMGLHATKIIYRASTLMIVNNFLFDICRPAYHYLSKENFQYRHYLYRTFGIPLPKRKPLFVRAAYPIQTNPTYSYFSTYPQLQRHNNPRTTTINPLPQHQRPLLGARPLPPLNPPYANVNCNNSIYPIRNGIPVRPQ